MGPVKGWWGEPGMTNPLGQTWSLHLNKRGEMVIDMKKKGKRIGGNESQNGFMFLGIYL
jgi:hypothetical protein